MKSPIIAVALAISLGIVGIAHAFDAEYTIDKDVTISKAGSYLVTGSGGGKITIEANLTDVELTLRDVKWANQTSMIDIKDGASLSLVLKGKSTVKYSGIDSLAPQISLPQTSSLEISGDGELFMQTYRGFPCIGVGPGKTMGTFTMNGGTVTAHAGGTTTWGLSAAIGGAYGNHNEKIPGGNGGTVIVNGGKLVAIGYGNAPGIGGGMSYNIAGGDAGSLTINGGYVFAMSRDGCLDDTSVSPAIGPAAARLGAGVHGKPGRITVAGGILEACVEMPDAACFGFARKNAKSPTIPDGSGLFVTGGTVKWNRLVIDEGFIYSFENCNVGYSQGEVFARNGVWMPVDTDLTTFFSSGVNFDKGDGKTVPFANVKLVDLASGDVALDSTSPFTIVCSSASSANRIVATGSIEAAIMDVKSTGVWAVPTDSTSTIYVYGDNRIVSSGIAWMLPETGTLSFKGEGRLLCEANGNDCAIGINSANKWGTLIVDGPTVQADGCYRSSGIGLSYSYDQVSDGGGKVVVESGTLIANGRGYAPAIGGGSIHVGMPANGPEVIVKTNGTLYANNIVDNPKTGISGGNPEGRAAGLAIGAGVNRNDGKDNYWRSQYAADAGTITVDGGTIYATVANPAIPCFGVINREHNGVQNPEGTGSLTVKNGGKVFFSHSTFPGKYKVVVDNGTLGTMDNTPADEWVTFNSNSIVTNALTITGPVSARLDSLPSFKNNPVLNFDTDVTVTSDMNEGEWVEFDGRGKLSSNSESYPVFVKRTKSENGRVLARFESREGLIDVSELGDEYDVFVHGEATISSATANSGTGVIVLNDGAVATFNGLNFASTGDNGYHSAVVVKENANAKIILKGKNSLKRLVKASSVIHLPASATLTIDGDDDGWLRIVQKGGEMYEGVTGIGVSSYDMATSMGTFVLDGGNLEIEFDSSKNTGVPIGVLCGDRNAGKVIVNGGTLSAKAGALCPAIGGGYYYKGRAADGGEVIVNGGVVTAMGYGGSPAIGGGTTYGWAGVCGKGGSFTLNGGTVYAFAYKSGIFNADGRCGAAIGGPASRDRDEVGGMGSVTINDGTLYAWAAVGAPIGHGNTTSGSFTFDNGSDGAFTIKGGSVKLVSGNEGVLSHVEPTDGVNEEPLSLVTVRAAKFGAAPYALRFVKKSESGNTLAYSYNGSGYADDENLYFYMPHGFYKVNDKSWVNVGAHGINFYGFVLSIQ